MARNSSGSYMTPVKRGRNGNPQATVWCKRSVTKTGKEIYGGTWSTPEGKKIYISFMPATAKVMKDRSGKDVKMLGVTLTSLPAMAEVSDAFGM